MQNLISIIIPVYNQAQEIERCLNSVLAQSYGYYEVIIVNDGSTDYTAKILDEMKQKFWDRKIRCKIVSQSNSGSNFARNRGFKEARGNLFKPRGEGREYVIFWDADIIGRPNMLEKMAEALKNNPRAAYAYCSFIYGKKKFKLWQFDEKKLREMPYIHTTSLIRKELFCGWDERISRLQDWDVFLTMLEQGHQGVWVPDFLFTVLVESGKISKWLPKYAYKVLPWLSDVKKYKQAVEVIKKKHKI